MHTRKHYGDREGNGYYDNRTQPETSQLEERGNVCWFMFGIIRQYVEFLIISKLKKCGFFAFCFMLTSDTAAGPSLFTMRDKLEC